MKLKTSKSNIDTILLNSKIFQTIKFPENKKGLSDIQKYISKLGKSVKLLDTSKSNEKKIKRNSIHISSSVILKNKKEENKNDDYKSYNKSKIRTKLYRDKISRNKLILNRILKNKEKNEGNIINIKTTNNKIRNTKTSGIFVTSFDFPKVKEKNEKKDDSGILKTDLNDMNKKYINSRFRNYKLSLPKIGSYSTRGSTIELPYSPNRINSHIIRPNNSFNKKLSKNKLYTKEEPTDKKKENPEKLDLHQLNQKLISLFGYDFKHSTPISPQIGNFLKRLKRIKNLLNKKNYEYELDKWIMRSKMKYAKWKFGIDELEKYFMNVDEFGIKEKNEIELRKSFYKKLNILIDELKEEKEMKKIKEREKFYGINIKEEKEVVKKNEYWKGENAMKIMKEQSQFLKMTKERKIKEQKNREIIERILMKTKQTAFNINNH